MASKKKTPPAAPQPSSGPSSTTASSPSAAAPRPTIARPPALPPFKFTSGPRSSTTSTATSSASSPAPASPPATTEPAPPPAAPEEPEPQPAAAHFAQSSRRWSERRAEREEEQWWKKNHPRRIPQADTKLAHVVMDALFVRRIPPGMMTIILSRTAGPGRNYDLTIGGDALACEYPDRRLYELVDERRRAQEEAESFEGRITARFPDGTLESLGWGTMDLPARKQAAPPWASAPPWGGPPPWAQQPGGYYGAPPWAAGGGSYGFGGSPWGAPPGSLEARFAALEARLAAAMGGGGGGFFTSSREPPKGIASDPALLELWRDMNTRISEALTHRNEQDPLTRKLLERAIDRAFDDEPRGGGGSHGRSDKMERAIDRLVDKAIDRVLEGPQAAPTETPRARLENVNGKTVAFTKDGDIDPTMTTLFTYGDDIAGAAKAGLGRFRTMMNGPRSSTSSSNGASGTNGASSNGGSSSSAPKKSSGPASPTSAS